MRGKNICRTGFAGIKFFGSVLFLVFINSFAVYSQQPFALVANEKKTVKESDLPNLEKDQTLGQKSGADLSFNGGDVHLVVLTGPEDDMLSYRIQGVRSPNLVVSSGATLKILFINVDEDMRHDLRFGQVIGDFPVAPDVKDTGGSERLTAKSEDGSLQAEEIVIKANKNGRYKYFCSVRGHAKGGMWGNILVGVKPDKDLKMPEKIPGMKMDDKKPGDMSDMKMNDKKSDMSDMKMNDKKSDMSDMNMDGKKSNMPGMNMPGMSQDKMEMPAVTDIGSPMMRESSGTAWVPDTTPMYAVMKMFGDGSMLMFHGNMFFRYTRVGSSRDLSVAGKGSRQRFDAPSMFMLMYSKPVNKRFQIGLRAMVSLDPAIERGYGYPLLFQSGESFRGRPLHDRQHPHDFFSELSATFSYKFSEKQSFYFYAGYPGEPALGPPTYVHRISAMNNPDAPLGHHWQDSTHITFGVLTAGYNFGKFKFEASAFKGREPDENRWNFDSPRLDSFSGRFSFNPSKEWAFQISHGYLKNPEPNEPELKILRRTTASAIYNKKISDEKNWASSFVWGQNYGNGERTNAFLVESNYDFYKNSVFGRFEGVQKSGHELDLNPADEDRVFGVSSFSIGYLRELVKNKNLNLGIGGLVALNGNPSSLNAYYGGTTHGSWQIFVRVRPSAMK